MDIASYRHGILKNALIKICQPDIILKKIPPFNNILSLTLTILLDGDHEIGPNDKGIFETLVVICIGVGILSSFAFYLCIKVVKTPRKVYHI